MIAPMGSLLHNKELMKNPRDETSSKKANDVLLALKNEILIWLT